MHTLYTHSSTLHDTHTQTHTHYVHTLHAHAHTHIPTHTHTDRAKLAPSLLKPLVGSGDGRSQTQQQQQGVELAVPGQKPSEPAADKPKTPSSDAPLRWAALAVFGAVTILIMIVLLVLIAI